MRPGVNYVFLTTVFGILTGVFSHYTAQAAGPIDFNDLQPLSDKLNIRYQSTSFNRRTGQLRTKAIITNTSSDVIQCPLILAITSFSTQGISLANADGQTTTGDPFVDLSTHVGIDGILAPGESSETLTLIFDSQSGRRRRFTFQAIGLGVIVIPRTTLTGVVQDENQLPVSGANVMLAGQLIATTESDGTFSVPNVTIDTIQNSVLRVRVSEGIARCGVSALVQPVFDGTTDMGVITIKTKTKKLWSSLVCPAELAAIDTASGSASIVGPIRGLTVSGRPTDLPVVAIEFSPDNSVLFATTSEDTGTIHAIDPETGESIAAVALQRQGGGIRALEFDSNGDLLGVFNDLQGTSDLIRVNPTTGEVTTIGPIGFGPIGGMVFDDQGNLWAITCTVPYLNPVSQGSIASKLIKIDPATGQGTEIATLDLVVDDARVVFCALEYDCLTGTLLTGGLITSGDRNFYEIDPTTGKVLLIGPTGAGFSVLTGLVFMPLTQSAPEAGATPPVEVNTLNAPLTNDLLPLDDFEFCYDGQIMGYSYDSAPWRRFGPATNDNVMATNHSEKTISGSYSGEYCVAWPNKFGAVRYVFDSPTDLTAYVAASAKVRSDKPVTPTKVKLAVSNGDTTYATIVAWPLSTEPQEYLFSFRKMDMIRTDGHQPYEDVIRNITTVGLDFLNYEGSPATETLIFDDFMLLKADGWNRRFPDLIPRSRREALVKE